MSTSVEETIRAAAKELAKQHDTARLDVELLLAHVLGKDRSWLRAWPEYVLTEKEQERFSALVLRRSQGEPIAHIIGTQEFWSLQLKITPDTLIPRPETECLIEQALALIPSNVAWRIFDLGTGSGAIALALAKERPACEIIATDRNLSALHTAMDNAVTHGIHNIHFVAGNWLVPFKPQPLAEVIISNPPYIIKGDPHLTRGDVRFEPLAALASGDEGLDDITKIIAQATAALKPGGWLLLEHGYHQADAISALLEVQGYESIRDHRDYNGQPRVAVAQKPETVNHE